MAYPGNSGPTFTGRERSELFSNARATSAAPATATARPRTSRSRSPHAAGYPGAGLPPRFSDTRHNTVGPQVDSSVQMATALALRPVAQHLENLVRLTAAPQRQFKHPSELLNQVDPKLRKIMSERATLKRNLKN